MMAKLKAPLLSFFAQGPLGRIITFRTSGKSTVAEHYPIPTDPKTAPQLAWRTLFQQAVDWWHTLSPAEKTEWEALARPRHMTGYALFVSTALRPNPGIYLPLLGGTMQGNIAMASNKITGLPTPAANNDAARKKYVDDEIAAAAAQLTKFSPATAATELWRRDDCEDSSFEALINGTPTATRVYYDNDVRERSLPDPTARPQWAKTILRNVTRGNTRKITDVNVASDYIDTESSVDNWANNDIITIGSDTCVYIPGGHTYSALFELDISAEVPATALAVLIQLSNNENSGVGATGQNECTAHPFMTWAGGRAIAQWATAAYQRCMSFIILEVVDQKICFSLGAFGPINASDMTTFMRLRGYWE